MYRAIVIGTSAGGLEALKTVLFKIKKVTIPIIIVQHLSPRHQSYLPSILSQQTPHTIKEIDEKERIESGIIYIAPPNYHVLIEKDFTFSLTTDERVSYARPSIDVTFETASDAYGRLLIGVLLTGANHDGAKGIETIARNGGYTIVQDPKTAYADEMPTFALERIKPSYLGGLEDIGHHINDLLSRR